MDAMLNTFPSESFLTESSFDVIEHLGMCRISLVQDVPELKVSGTQAVAEVLGKNPSTIYTKNRISVQIWHRTFEVERTSIGRLLNSVPRLVVG
jgi:hypothetical protein